jgi:peroxiredoxin
MMLLEASVPWLIVCFGCWIGYQLVQQNGRLLLRLEALEKQLAGLTPAPARPAAPAAPQGLPIGSAAPEFALPDLAGERRALSDFRGKKALLIFFNPGCGFCQKMVPDLAALPADGDDAEPVPLVITTGDAERNRQLLKETRCPVLIQERSEVASAYQAHGTPTGYLLDEEGKIAIGLTVGAQALLDLAEGKATALPEPSRNGHGPQVGSRDLSQSKINRSGLAPGTLAPDFRLPLLEGGELSLSELRGRKVLLVFSDPHCGPCDAVLPQLQERVPSSKFQVPSSEFDTHTPIPPHAHTGGHRQPRRAGGEPGEGEAARAHLPDRTPE